MTTLFGEPSKDEFPQPRLEDVGIVGGKAVASIASIVPGIGTFGVFGSALLTLLNPPVDQRRADWFEDLGRRLRDLETRFDGFKFESLRGNKHFVSAVMQATHAALRTHHQEKRDALRNAVLNVAVDPAPNDDLHGIFLNLIDSLTPLHLRLLMRFSSMAPASILEAPAWLKSDICLQAAKDLFDRGLIGNSQQHLRVDRGQLLYGENGMHKFQAGTTQFGSKFLSFINEPKPIK